MLAQHLGRYLLFTPFVVGGLYVHFRGRERHPWSRQLLDHSTFMAPYNALMYLFSAVKARPYAPVSDFGELAALQANWQIIRQEALALQSDGHIRAAAGYNDIGFNSFFRQGWKRFYLKWYDEFLPSARALCPETTALLRAIPSVKAAMFASLPPGGRLSQHRDPFAGSLRYHLGLITPNSEQCHIVVDGQSYHWRDGEAVVFDETYLHYVENKTDQARVILFCDVERPLKSSLVRAINRTLGRGLIRAAATQNVPGEHLGALNRIFGYLYAVRRLGKRLKQWHRPTYYALKWTLVFALACRVLG